MLKQSLADYRLNLFLFVKDFNNLVLKGFYLIRMKIPGKQQLKRK